jgi:hypothetical protein
MRSHHSGATLSLGADDLDDVIRGLLTGDRDALILANDLNVRWRAAVEALSAAEPGSTETTLRCRPSWDRCDGTAHEDEA